MAGDPRLTTRARKKLRMVLGLLWASEERPCAKCRKRIDYARGWDLDEIVPRVLGGDPMDIANLQPAHIRCNRSAGATLGNRLKGQRNAGLRRRSTMARRFDTTRQW